MVTTPQFTNNRWIHALWYRRSYLQQGHGYICVLRPVTIGEVYQELPEECLQPWRIRGSPLQSNPNTRSAVTVLDTVTHKPVFWSSLIVQPYVRLYYHRLRVATVSPQRPACQHLPRQLPTIDTLRHIESLV